MPLVVKTVTFDAAHFLPNYKGPCHNLHGHHWEVQVGLWGPIDPVTGMVVDFKWVKKNLEFVQLLDHALVNDTIENPTAENIAEWIKDRFLRETRLDWPEGLSLNFVRVWETEDSYAEA